MRANAVDISHEAARSGGSHALLAGRGAHVDSDDGDDGYVVGVFGEGDDVEVGAGLVVGDLELNGSNAGGVSLELAKRVDGEGVVVMVVRGRNVLSAHTVMKRE